jgi:tetratricopeptide (TPR) repeat protein
MTLNNHVPDKSQAYAMAWQLLQAGNPGAAEEIVKPLLVHGLTDELAPLIAMIRLQQQRFSEAAPLFERARALQPHEARFAFLHGLALAGMGEPQHAVPAFQAAIKREPHVAAAYLSLGEAQRKLRLLEEAQATYRKLLRLQPDNVDCCMALSSVLMEMEQAAEAEAPLRRALLHAKDRKTQAALHNNLAISLSSQNRHAEVLESLDRAQALALELPNIDERRIDILYKLGRFDECVLLYKKLLERNPANPEMHRAYNSLLYRLGRMDQYLASYDRAPQTRDMMLGKASMLTFQKRGAEAHEIFSGLLAHDPHDALAAAGLASSLLLMGRYGESVAAFEALVNRSGANAAIFSGAAEAAMMAGDPDKAESFCQAGLCGEPYDQNCLALLGTAWRLKGDERDEELNGYDSLIRSFDLEPPDGYSSMESFNAELGIWLVGEHPGTREYVEQTLRGGTQTEGFLFGAGNALVKKLRVRIDEAVSRYILELAPDDQHPFLARRRGKFSFAGAWSSLMKDQGFHVNHLHPQGWISSCYYVAVPEVAKDAGGKQGWIKFGEPALDVPLRNPVRRAIQPVPGRLVLFPSYMWHGTIPFHAEAVRTTIAFDAVPVG